MGDILLQEKIEIADLTDGQLRQELASLSEKSIGKFLNLLFNDSLHPVKQDKNKGKYYPKVMSREGIEMLQSGNLNRTNIIKGLTPYPGVGILDKKGK